MAREPVVAVDFLGLGTSMREIETEVKAEKERGKLGKPTSSSPAVLEQSSAIVPAGDDEPEIRRRPLVLGIERSHLSGPLTFSLSQAMPWASVLDNVEQMERSRLAVPPAEEKRVDELSDADIMQLSGDECRRYMIMMKKEREEPRPTSNFASPSGQATSKPWFRMETRNEDNRTNKRGGTSTTNVLLEASALTPQSGPTLQHDVAGPSSTSGGWSVLQVPWRSVQSQTSLLAEVQAGVCPSDRAVHTTSSVSPFIPSNQEQSIAQSSGYGSPLPNYLKVLRSTEHSQRPLQVNHYSQGSIAQVGVLSRSTGQSHLPGRPPTAQLTIFYSGMVNVYDRVPADKAQAIMLLAGSGSSWSSSIMNPPSASVLPSTGGMASSSNSPARSGPASAVAGVSQAGPVTSPLLPTIAVTAGLKQGVGRPTLHAELPQARKASLARFLEKRKDRVRGKAPYVPAMFSMKKDVGSSTPVREKSPSPINGNSSTRSPSPANGVLKVNVVSLKRSLSPAQRPGPSQPRGSDASSPKSHMGTFRQGALANSSEDQASTSATHRPRPEDILNWGGQQRPRPSAPDKRLNMLEEGTGSPSQHE